MKSTPDYGLDAPGVVRNLALVAVAGMVVRMTAAAGWWSGTFAPTLGGVHVSIPLSRMVLFPAIACGLMAVWMVWDSRIGKLHARERMLDRIGWTGTERVLDVGCGRGLLLIGAAKRLTSGKAVGIDLWQAEDLSGNGKEATLKNARAEGVADRVEVETGDMRKMPFANAAFDVIVSRFAVHNLYSLPDRAKAIAEITRVLKPGGRALIEDIRHGDEYISTFCANGCDVTRVGSMFMTLLLVVLTFGSLRPSTLLVERRRVT